MRIGTRGSALARAQAQLVAAALKDAAALERCEVVPIATAGDRGAGAADKSRWVDELEDALARGAIDLAVHSAKDVPGELAEGLALLGAPARAPAEDVICGAAGVTELRRGARVGTSSLRRAAQLRAAREDLDLVSLHGNVDTRLRKLDQRGELDAVVLARAGLARLGRESAIGAVLDPGRFVPAPGQGTLALEGRSEDADARAAVATIGDPDTFACLLAERGLARELAASCKVPLGAHAAREPAGLRLRAWVGLPDGSQWIRDELVGELAQPDALAADLAARLRAVGAEEVLARAQEMASVGSG